MRLGRNRRAIINFGEGENPYQVRPNGESDKGHKEKIESSL